MINSLAISQIYEHKLCITNESDQIYAVVNHNIVDSLNNVQEKYIESYSDFIFHSNKLKDNVNAPVKIYISDIVFFEEKEIDIATNSQFNYIIIKKGNVEPLILNGIDTWVSLKNQIDRYFED